MEINNPPNSMAIRWGIVGAVLITVVFYSIQALSMQSWISPIWFMRDQWYLILPLIIGFGIQAGLFRAIHERAKHGGGTTIATSGSVSSAGMLACCLHNLIPLFPVLGISGIAIFFAAYQTDIFLISILISYTGVGYMIWKYKKIKVLCHPERSLLV